MIALDDEAVASLVKSKPATEPHRMLQDLLGVLGPRLDALTAARRRSSTRSCFG